MAKVRVLKDKVCSRCKTVYSPRGTSQKYCETCIPIILKENSDRHRLNKGIPVGIGSGNSQGRGEGHHTYKTGIGGYRDKVKASKPAYCERCSVSIDYSNTYKWCVHHKDHNRHNNQLDNLELLCKRCHQIEHRCMDQLPQYRNKV